MYDYLKIVLPPDCKDKLLNCPLLDFKRQYSEKTGEGQNYSIAKYNGLQWIIYESGTILLKGSIHKFHNQGLHNYNDYTLTDFIQDLQILEKDFCIVLKFTKIDTLEIGVNIIPPIPSKKILNNLLLHKRNKFQDKHLKDGDYRQCVHKQFILKCYHKSKQYKLPGDLLRWEVKFTKMEQLRKFGIYTLFDLTKPNIIKKLGKILVKKFEEVIMYDHPVKYRNLQENDRIKLKDWSNPNWWIELIESTPRSNKNKIGREVEKFRKFLKTNSANTQDIIRVLISDKWGQLTNFPEEVIIHELGKIDSSYIQAVFPNYINKTSRITHTKKGDKIGQIGPTKKKSFNSGFENMSPNKIAGITVNKKRDLDNESINDLDKNQKDKFRGIRGLKKRCLVTGLDISMQKENSRFLSIAGIRFYYENEPETYKELEKRLSDKWKNSDLDVRFCEVAHSIRNEYTNNKPRIKKLIEDKNSLFDNREFINPDLLKRYCY